MGPCTRGRGGARRGGTGRARLWYCFAGEKLRIASTVSLHQENVPLSKANHFVVGEPVGSHGSGEAASWCDAFYLSLGRRVRETIADGDCALDALCIVSGADRTLPSRNALRVELSNVLLGRLGGPARTHPRLRGAPLQGRQVTRAPATTKHRRHSLGFAA